MTARRSWLVFVLAAGLGFAALLIAASVRTESRAFVLDSPSQHTVARLAPGQRACEGPVQSPEPVGGVRVWGQARGGLSALEVNVAERDGARSARGRIPITRTSGPYDGALSRDLPAGRQLTVCLRATGPAPVSLLGSPPVDPDVLISVAGRQRQAEFSLALLRGPPRSLLALMPTAFARAARFHAAWMGTWTFWLLAVGLLVTVPLGAVSLRAAGRCDERARP